MMAATSSIGANCLDTEQEVQHFKQFSTIRSVLSITAALNLSLKRSAAVKALNAEPKRNDSIVPSAATTFAPDVVEKAAEVIDIEKLAKDLENSSPLTIMDKALEKYGNDIAIAFSGAEDVALIEYAHLTGRQFRVRPLRRVLKGLRAWITGQRKDQSPGTRSEVPVVQVHPVFEGMDGGSGSLVKFNPVANVAGNDIWSFLRTMDVPVNPLHAQRYVSIGCEPCTRSVLPGNLKEESVNGNGNGNGNGNSAADIFESQNVVNLTRTEIENLVKMEDLKDVWMVVLYAPWCLFCQAMEASYVELADKLSGSGVKVGKFRADGDQKSFAKQELQLGSFPTILFFPKHLSRPIKCRLCIENLYLGVQVSEILCKRKSITTIKGLELLGIKVSDASKKLGKKFATGASVVKGPTEKEQIDVQ
ncbi:hypothetical protein L2E82_47413 [Cichorium intybus]|uniref:Uncharacterized protein n=1 Tax=Cichorium intybus TaxID=13427 RepID=A0ACB8YWF9_CICIN|nr:hypothetical protein L2E82_47413 [Cichorium intybus]